MIWAVIRFEFEGFHRWKNAPDEVEFLRNVHRHIFKCEVWTEQTHVERDIEFIQLKNILLERIGYFNNCIDESCEAIAIKIKKWMEESYPDRKIKVGVFEDSENGAFVE